MNDPSKPRSLRIAAVATAFVLALPLLAMDEQAAAASSLAATFDPTASNEWWIQVKVSANGDVSGVDARVDGGPWKPLDKKSYGWAASVHAPSGSIVQFQAKGPTGSVVSGCYKWTSRAATSCPGGAPTAPAPAPSTGSATFTPKGGNEWWVQAKVSGSPTAVDARVDGGAWQPLKLQSWGDWAASIRAPEGSVVQFQAKMPGGAMATSTCYRWTSGSSTSCPSGSAPAPAPEPTTGGSESSTTFTPKNGKEWWVQVKVSGSPTKVEARDTDGAWTAMKKESWGDWTASFHVEPGHQVQFRATLSGGKVDTSCWFPHPGTTCASGAPTSGGSSGGGETPTTSGTLWQDSFTKSPWTSPWSVKSSWGMENFAVTKESGGKVPTFMRVKFPAGSASPALEDSAGAPKGGGEFKATLGLAPREKISMSYDIRFPTGFDFVRGGKLPGLYGGTGPSGGNIPTGSDGWSTRLMWREGGAGEVYAYLPTSAKWGSQIGTGNWHFKADGQWHTIEQEVTLNTPGSSDGEIKVWYDGKQVLHQKGVKFRTTSSLKADGIYFSTFFGGADASWATPKSVHIDFGNFRVKPSH